MNYSFLKRPWVVVAGCGVVLFLAVVIKDQVVDSPSAIAVKFKSKIQPVTAIFTSSRTLTYKLFYTGLVPAGTLKWTTSSAGEQGVAQIELTSVGTWMEMIIKASITMKSYMLPARDLASVSYEEETDVRGQKKSKRIDFDAASGVAVRDGLHKVAIDSQVYDPMSALIKMVHMPFERGERTIRFLSKEEIYALKFEQTIFTQSIYKFRVEARREDRSSSHGAEFEIWVTADSSRVPLAVKCMSPVGYVSAILSDVETGRIVPMMEETLA